MYSYSSLPTMGLDDLSVEVNSDGRSWMNPSNDMTADFGLNALFGVDLFDDISPDGVCEPDALAESLGLVSEPNEFDKYIFPSLSSNEPSDIEQNLLLPLNIDLPVQSTEKVRKAKANKKPIPLSSSVGVGLPQRVPNQPHKIEIVYDLEEKFRPRYKSDYFSQSGKNRKPRYVADRKGNHYITLKVPVGIRGQVRIDWLTIPDANNKRFVMPYRFQASNELPNVPDCNPYFEEIKCDNSGIMKLYLVLIKAKQDALKSLQPLQPFHPFRDALGIVDKSTTDKAVKLTPKQLIQKYHLQKSQLAFTLCTWNSDSQTYVAEWDTIVFSTVLEEESSDNATIKSVSCPNCSYAIPVPDDEIGDSLEDKQTSKRKQTPAKTPENTKTIKKQRSLPVEILGFE